ncbi:MAG: hypothetical protein CMQ07_01330 [Gammaproteobacteria bacterium]|nr:hypothetical protein [Gammaproteobacteria bacterium]
MNLARVSSGAFGFLLLSLSTIIYAHPLRLSLSQIEYEAAEKSLSITLRLFLTDVNEALVFDPYSTQLSFCQANEAPEADSLLLEYLAQFFYVVVNGETVALEIERKELSGQGDNTALGVTFVSYRAEELVSLEIKNAVFTDLFFDQSNIVYVYKNGNPTSLMLNKSTPIHKLEF